MLVPLWVLLWVPLWVQMLVLWSVLPMFRPQTLFPILFPSPQQMQMTAQTAGIGTTSLPVSGTHRQPGAAHTARHARCTQSHRIDRPQGMLPRTLPTSH